MNSIQNSKNTLYKKLSLWHFVQILFRWVCLFQDSWFKYCIIFKMYRKGKYIKFLSFQICVRTNYSCFRLCSFCFWGEVSNSWIFYYIGRNDAGRKSRKWDRRSTQCKAVLRIHDILLCIRIWIRGSMPLTNGPDPVPAIFNIGQQKIIFVEKFFCLLLFEGTFTLFFKYKMSKRSHKTVGIKVFLTSFAWW